MKSSEVDIKRTSQEPQPLSSTANDQTPNGDKASTMQAQEKTHKSVMEDLKTRDENKVDKLSGAELKKKAKEEKAAKRAREKQSQLQPTDSGPSRSKPEPPNGILKKTDATPGKESHAPKPFQHKKTGSVTANQPSPLTLRQAESKPSSVPPPAPKESKHVALFGHLYGIPRRSTIAGAGRDVHPAVLALGLQMSHYIICGSSARCVATLLVFKRVIESYTTPPQNSLPRHLTLHLSSQIEYLVSCRPLSVSMGNAIRWLKVEISEIDPSVPESTAKKDLCDSIDEFIRERITVADQVISSSAAEKISDGDVILTYAKSSIVQQTLVEAFRQGKKFRVVIIDSRPLFEGKNLARSLAAIGLKVQYALTTAISHAIKDVTKVFLGAHAMMSNGRLYSRVGTAIVAMTAKEAEIPVIVCCESIKFTDRVALDSIVTNELAPPDELIPQSNSSSSHLAKWRKVPNLQLLNLMFDLTPAQYITLVITEYGSLPPSSVPVVHRLSTKV